MYSDSGAKSCSSEDVLSLGQGSCSACGKESWSFGFTSSRALTSLLVEEDNSETARGGGEPMAPSSSCRCLGSRDECSVQPAPVRAQEAVTHPFFLFSSSCSDQLICTTVPIHSAALICMLSVSCA